MGRFSSFLGQSLSYKGSKAATDALWATGNGTAAYRLGGKDFYWMRHRVGAVVPHPDFLRHSHQGMGVDGRCGGNPSHSRNGDPDFE